MPLIVILVAVLLVAQPWADDEPVQEPAAAPAASAQPVSVSGCSLVAAGSPIEPTLSGCTKLFSDTAGRLDPLPLWGEIACEEDSRQRTVPSGGDPSPQATGKPQRNEGFRRLSAIDGDDVDGERCELGRNDHEEGPTVLYDEGQRRVTFLSVRLPDDFPLDDDVFQVVMQMKQTQPSANGGGTPVLALEAFDGRWRLRQSDSIGPTSDAHELWSAPAQTGTWTRFALDVTYSQASLHGRVKVYVDLNADGDFGDSEEQSEEFQTYTLKIETDDGDDGIEDGESIPSHLRIGLYHDPAYPCPAPKGCHVDLDNVQVIGP